MNSNKYTTYKNQGYLSKKPNKITPQFFRANIIEAKKLYDPQNDYINKTKNRINKVNKYTSSTKNYYQFKQILNNYMNDYEKLRKQNKIPAYPEIKYSFQEYEAKKNEVKELFDTFLEINGKDEFFDTNQIIENLPENNNIMLLKNDITKKDYEMRYKLIKGENYVKEEEEKLNEHLDNNQENIDNQDNNELNKNCYIENNEEEEEAENKDENIIKNNDIKNNEEQYILNNNNDINNIDNESENNNKEYNYNNFNKNNEEVINNDNKKKKKIKIIIRKKV
jgi:hypothetical protein